MTLDVGMSGGRQGPWITWTETRRTMHFSKTYAQLLLTLPPDLRESAIQYRQLKKIINQIVAELTSLGEHLTSCSLLTSGSGRHPHRTVSGPSPRGYPTTLARE